MAHAVSSHSMILRKEMAAKRKRGDIVRTADDGLPYPPLDPYLLATDELKTAMTEAITMAENAFNVMNDHASDGHVGDMLKLVLGEGTDYQSKFDAIKSEHNIDAFSCVIWF